MDIAMGAGSISKKEGHTVGDALKQGKQAGTGNPKYVRVKGRTYDIDNVPASVKTRPVDDAEVGY